MLAGLALAVVLGGMLFFLWRNRQKTHRLFNYSQFGGMEFTAENEMVHIV